MAHFKPRKIKTADDKSTITLYQDTTTAWFVGSDQPGDLSPIPMGAFATLEAARKWADTRFPGGSWQSV